MHKMTVITHLFAFFEVKKSKYLALILKIKSFIIKKLKKHHKKSCYFPFGMI
jgi:hypothetical protein